MIDPQSSLLHIKNQYWIGFNKSLPAKTSVFTYDTDIMITTMFDNLKYVFQTDRQPETYVPPQTLFAGVKKPSISDKKISSTVNFIFGA